MATPLEDFTFPITEPPPRFIDSPPLWWHSSPSTPSHKKANKSLQAKKVQEEEEEEESISAWRSFQDFKASIISQRKKKDGDEKEEKMDMLWEDLNEELATTCGKKPRNCENTLSTRTGMQRRVDANALKLSKTNADMLSGKKPNLEVVMKVLKKFLALRNSTRSIKKRG